MATRIMPLSVPDTLPWLEDGISPSVAKRDLQGPSSWTIFASDFYLFFYPNHVHVGYFGRPINRANVMGNQHMASRDHRSGSSASRVLVADQALTLVGLRITISHPARRSFLDTAREVHTHAVHSRPLWLAV